MIQLETNLQPVFDLGFWQKCYQMKLQELKLNDQPIEIYGKVECGKFALEKPLIKFNQESLEKIDYIILDQNYHQIYYKGELIIFNLKSDMEEAQQSLLKKQDQLDQLINKFKLYLFIDHKKYEFTYSFFIPIINDQELRIQQIQEQKTQILYENKQDLKKSFGFIINWSDQIFVDPMIDFKQLFIFTLLNILQQDNKQKSDYIIIKSPFILSKIKQQPNYIWIQIQKSENCFIVYQSIKENVQINLKQSLSQEEIVNQQIQLNVQLIKWRIDPLFNYEIYKRKTVLILGVGTLGSNIIYNLISYGYQNLILVDNGVLSYSNLSRQTLYNIESFQQEHNYKVDEAKKSIQRLNPLVKVETDNMQIPMPGHFISQQDSLNQYQFLQKLEEYIKRSDIVFNCLDSWEVWYFPCLFSSIYNKINISIGIGYQSFVGIVQAQIEDELKNKIKSGCYFCSDYVSPQDTLTGRTLDQQCTVTKPGVSMFACGSSIEFLDWFVQDKNTQQKNTCIQGQLGPQFQLQEFENLQYSECVCCSDKIIEEYQKNKKEFLMNILKDPKITQRITNNDQEEEFDINQDIIILE